jgi:hypothetical protein
VDVDLRITDHVVDSLVAPGEMEMENGALGTACGMRHSCLLPILRGAPKKKKMKAPYIWQMVNQVGRYLPFFFFFLFLWRFCAFLNKGSSKTP